MRFFLISSCQPYSSHSPTQSSETCLLPLGLEHLLALPWSFAPESWTGWDPKGALGPRGQQVKGKCAQPLLLGLSRAWTRSRRQAQALPSPEGDGCSPFGSRSAFSLCHGVSEPHRGGLESCFSKPPPGVRASVCSEWLLALLAVG